MSIILSGKKSVYVLLPLFFFVFTIFSYADTIKIVTYNILNFPEAIGMYRIDDFRKIIDYENPDILVVQEMQSQDGVDLFIDSVMNYHNNLFEAVLFNDGPDTDNALFFRSDKVEYLSSQYLSTPVRNIAEYRLKIIDSQREFYIFSVHFKASQGSNNEMIRHQEATILRNHLDSLDPGTNFLAMGDFNI
ncbi:endonuclease/exonuclease/phosphatase family protein, partial [candidate division WOR-3 bacterium]|nr:endonuclease/exonuclease/phosphatase family protein [candidate division WOR-3 bacterium]